MDGPHGFVDSSTEGHLAGFHLSAVVRDAAARTGAHVPVRVLLVLLGVCSPDGVAGSRGEAIAEFEEPPCRFPRQLHLSHPR